MSGRGNLVEHGVLAALELDPFRRCGAISQALDDLATAGRLRKPDARREQRIRRRRHLGLAGGASGFGQLEAGGGVGQLAGLGGPCARGHVLEGRRPLALHERGANAGPEHLEGRAVNPERPGEIGLGGVLGKLPQPKDDTEPEAGAHWAAPNGA